MYHEFARHICSFCLPFHPLIDLVVIQWVPQLKRSGLNGLFLARHRLLFPEHIRMQAISTRLGVRHSRSWALTRRASMLCLEAMHNVSMRLGRMDVHESGHFNINVWERLAVVARCMIPRY